MAPRSSVPVLLLTGFLGSGKTSLLARWLKAPDFAGAMVIVNELGEVGLDDRLVETSSEAPLLLDNGCACCAASEDLAATLERLFWDRLHRRIPSFAWVLIETTGVADPAPIRRLIETHSLLSERYHLAGTITTFDARRGCAQLAEHGECRRQLEGADVIVLTKSDLADAAELSAAEAAIGDVRPGARLLRSARSNLPADTVLAAIAARPSPPVAHGHHEHGHLRDVSTAFVSLEPMSEAQLTQLLTHVLRAHRDDLLRLKGAVRIQPDARWHVVQAMPGDGVTLSPLPRSRGDEPRAGVTIISRNTPASAIAATLDAAHSIPAEGP